MRMDLRIEMHFDVGVPIYVCTGMQIACMCVCVYTIRLSCACVYRGARVNLLEKTVYLSFMYVR